MDTTPLYALPYLELEDPPDIPGDGRASMLAVEAQIQRLDASDVSAAATAAAATAALATAVGPGGVWTNFVPTYTGLTLGTTGLLNVARWVQHGKIVTAMYDLTLGTGGAATGTIIPSLPVAAAAASPAHIGTAFSSLTSANRKGGLVELNSASVFVIVDTLAGTLWGVGIPFAWAAGAVFRAQVCYEAA